MKRINLGNGKWFDQDRAQNWEEATRFDGRNHISVNTGDQFYHEQLWRTAKGKWLLNEWSQWQGGYDTWKEISEAQAHAWLVRNEHYEVNPEATEAAEV